MSQKRGPAQSFIWRLRTPKSSSWSPSQGARTLSNLLSVLTVNGDSADIMLVTVE